MPGITTLVGQWIASAAGPHSKLFLLTFLLQQHLCYYINEHTGPLEDYNMSRRAYILGGVNPVKGIPERGAGSHPLLRKRQCPVSCLRFLGRTYFSTGQEIQRLVSSCDEYGCRLLQPTALLASAWRRKAAVGVQGARSQALFLSTRRAGHQIRPDIFVPRVGEGKAGADREGRS